MENNEISNRPKTVAIEQNATPEIQKDSPFQTVIVAGMGPVDLAEITASDRLFPNSPYARRNAQAAKVLASRGLSEEVIMSGFQSNPETDVSEAQLQGDTYDRMRATFLPKEMRPEAEQRAKEAYAEEPEAETTFANIIRSLNLLDAKEKEGLYTGKFSVLSSQFHIPRIAEMIKAFGLDAAAISAEEILEYYGYSNIDPKYIRNRDNTEALYQDKLKRTYSNQPAGLENLQDNPAYVTFELAKIQSDERLQQIATSLRNYYHSNGVSLPPCYDSIPDQFDSTFNYKNLRDEFSKITFTKHPYTGDMTGTEYQELARTQATATTRLLKEVDPEPPQVKNT